MDAELVAVLGNSQRLDGGAMFGNAPRALWSRWCPPDDLGRIELATRALLVREASGRHLLFETGIGAFFPPELRERYGVEGDGHVLLANLERLGLVPADIDVIVLSHLHFDHAGGLLAEHHPQRGTSLAFPSARILVSDAAWDRAQHPHLRDRASFISGLTELLRDSGRLELVDGERSDTLGPDYRFHRSDGHTPGLLLTEMAHSDGPVLVASDLIPGVPWVHLPITMGYDRAPELLIDEKAALLDDLVRRDGRLFFTHDTEVAVARVERDDRGRYNAVPVDQDPLSAAVEDGSSSRPSAPGWSSHGSSSQGSSSSHSA